MLRNRDRAELGEIDHRACHASVSTQFLAVANAVMKLDRLVAEARDRQLDVGGRLVATGTFSDQSTADITRQCVWSSSSKALAVVSRGGVVRGVQPGAVTITAKRSGKFGRASGTVE